MYHLHDSHPVRPWIAVGLAACMLAACRGNDPVVVVHGERGPVSVRVELALTPEEQSRGLMWRDSLDPDAGMLFVFPRDGELNFWMKNTPVPLDIIYIDRDGRVVSVGERTTPYSLARIPSGAPARYALEVNAGFADLHGVGPGTRVELPPLPEPPAGRRGRAKRD